MSAQFKYVTAAIAIMKLAKTDRDLVEVWKGEKPNRDMLNLSPDVAPGLDLLTTFQILRSELTRN